MAAAMVACGEGFTGSEAPDAGPQLTPKGDDTDMRQPSTGGTPSDAAAPATGGDFMLS